MCHGWYQNGTTQGIRARMKSSPRRSPLSITRTSDLERHGKTDLPVSPENCETNPRRRLRDETNPRRRLLCKTNPPPFPASPTDCCPWASIKCAERTHRSAICAERTQGDHVLYQTNPSQDSHLQKCHPDAQRKDLGLEAPSRTPMRPHDDFRKWTE